MTADQRRGAYIFVAAIRKKRLVRPSGSCQPLGGTTATFAASIARPHYAWAVAA
jgi:hypothetical protein